MVACDAGQADAGVLHHHLLRVATATYAGHVRLSGNLLISTPTATGRQADLNNAKAMEAMHRRQRLVVVAPLAQYQAGMEEAQRLPIAGFHGIPHLALTPEAWDVLQRKFRIELNGWMSGEQVVAIVQTDVPTPVGGSVRAQVSDIALMLTTPQWILVAEGRRFDKPLRFDSGQDQVFPDFWLLDAGDPLPMEVWGMSDTDYIERKNEKTAHYDEKYGAGTWWQWDAASGDPLPPFPSARSRTV